MPYWTGTVDSNTLPVDFVAISDQGVGHTPQIEQAIPVDMLRASRETFRSHADQSLAAKAKYFNIMEFNGQTGLSLREARACYGSKAISRCLRATTILIRGACFCSVSENGGGITTSSKVPVPSDHKSPIA